MRFRSRKMAIAIGLIGMGGFLMAGPGTGCASFLGESGLATADFCFIFDCQNGILGGTLDPCVEPQNPIDIAGQGFAQTPLFVDCVLGAEGP